MASLFKRFANWLGESVDSVLQAIPSPYSAVRSLFGGGSGVGVPDMIGNAVHEGVDNVADWAREKWDETKDSNLYRSLTGSGLTDAQLQQNAFEERMSNTAYQRQVSDMQAAGVNSALSMAGSANGASTPSGSSGQIGSLGFADIVGAIASIASLPAQIRKLNADSRAANAEAKKKETETPWIDKLNLADLMSKKVGYQLSKEQFEVIEYAKHKTLSEIAHLTAQTESEEVRRFWLESDIALKHMQATEIAQLLPYRQLLMDAQTDAQRAEASFRVLQRANQEKLWTDEYIDSLIHISIAEAGIKDSEDTFKRVKNIVNGVTAFEDDTELNKVGIQVGESLRRIIPGAKPIYSE